MYSIIQQMIAEHFIHFVAIFCTQLIKAFVAETSCNQLLIDIDCYVVAHNQFAYNTKVLHLDCLVTC